MMKRTNLWLPIVVCAAVGACSDEPTPVAEEPGAAAAASAAAAAATERIVYSSLRPGNWDIYLLRERRRRAAAPHGSSGARLRRRAFAGRPLGRVHVGAPR